MKKNITLLFMLCLLGVVSTNIYGSATKGQRVYLKKCKKCHGIGTKGATMHTQNGWLRLFDNGAILIIQKHKGTKAAKFFNGKRFKKLYPHLKDFLWKYGSDSGNVPMCG